MIAFLVLKAILALYSCIIFCMMLPGKPFLCTLLPQRAQNMAL